jgi:YidC/Oxa1 family membrane protein insertase
MLQDKDKMHPDDIRNLLIFAFVSIMLWSAYEAFVLQPKKEAIQKRHQIERLIAKKEAETGVEIVSKPVVRARNTVLAEDRRFTFDNGQIMGTISTRGGRIDDVSFQNYYQTRERKDKVVLLSPRDTAQPRFIDTGWVAKEPGLALPDAETIWQVDGNDRLAPEKPVTLRWDNGSGLIFTREFSLDENYMFSVQDGVQNNTGKPLTLYPYGLITQTGIPVDVQNIWILHEGPIGFMGEELIQSKYPDLKEVGKIEKTADKGWIGITDKYWLTALVPPQDSMTKYTFNHRPNLKDNTKGRYQVDYTGAGIEIKAGETGQAITRVFTGAKEVLKLDAYQENLKIPNFNLAVDFGWFWFMTQPFFYILHWLHEQVGNMGVAIILLTIIIRSAVFPLTNTSYRSFAKMKKVAPQINDLRTAYGDDKQKLQEEIIKLYSREGVNPLAGCLPILVQIPIFFSLYKVFFVTIEMRHAPFFGWIQDLSAPDPTNIFNLFGLLDFEPPSFLHIGIWPLFMLVIMLIQKRLNPPPQDKIQRDMMNIFPFIITYMMGKFAAGLVVYWTFSGLISILQQMIIMRSLGVPIYILGQYEDEIQADKALAKSADVHPLAEMAEEEIEKAMFGETASDGETPPDITPPKPKKKKKKK